MSISIRRATVLALTLSAVAPGVAQAGSIRAARVAARHWAVQDSASGWGVTHCHHQSARVTVCNASESDVVAFGDRSTVTYYLTVVRRRDGGYVVAASLWDDRVTVSARRALPVSEGPRR